jgi:NADPH:quinone reductase-like Zn-dependent oxidoreductase
MASSRIFSWWSIAVVGISAAVLSLLSFPNPELDWEGAVLPDARKYMQEMGVATPSAEQPLEGLVVAVTGATSGIGLELTRKLAKLGATVLAIGRSPKKLQQLQDDIPGVQTVVANLADLASVADASDYMLDKYDHLDVLINNAGIHQGLKGMWEFPVTEQGYDMAFGGKNSSKLRSLRI